MIQNELFEMINCNRHAKVNKIEAFPLDILADDNLKESIYSCFFCGAVRDRRGHIIGIPNKYPHILEICPENNEITQWGNLSLPDRKGWTGGAAASTGRIYAFPRGANSILEIDTVIRQVNYIEIGISYNEEHHYGGAMKVNDCIYQPPKNSNRILKYDIEKSGGSELIIHSIVKKKFLFYGSMTDLNDIIYFFPAGRFCRVCMVDRNEKVRLIGRYMTNAFFNSGALSADGDIYGFSSYGKGILHIDTKRKRTEILQKSFQGGFYGAKLALNGKLYAVPGDSNVVAEFDPETGSITDLIPLPDVEIGVKAKCAGGAIDRKGNIWCVPAMGHYVYKICFEGLKVFPSEQLFHSKFFTSFY